MKTIKFYTLGCKVNQYDTQGIREKFLSEGFKEIDNGRKADIYVINTCTVTQSADRKSRQFIHQAHSQNPKARIIVTGCYTELDADKILKIKGVTEIIKNKDKEDILKGISYFRGHTRAFLKVQDGCDNFCSYCKVPLVRGRSRSRAINEIIREAERLVENGFKEIVLCGVCLGAYGRDLGLGLNLVKLIEELEKISGLLRIRLSSIEAVDVGDELVLKMQESKKLMPHLHIPLQSGDDEILKKMRRNYSAQDYLGLIKRIREQIPHAAISTDCLVGFPGEREDNFQNTMNLIKEILPLKVHIFPYSKREETLAGNFKDEVSKDAIRKRFLRLQEIAKTCAATYKKQFLNKNMDVLIESRSKRNPAFWEGYTNNYIKVLIKSNRGLKNQIISVKLKRPDLDKDFCQENLDA